MSGWLELLLKFSRTKFYFEIFLFNFEKLKVFKDYFRQILKSFGCLNRPEFISVLTIQLKV